MIFTLAGVDLMAGMDRWFCFGSFVLDCQDDDQEAENDQSQSKRNQILH
jgi:hypothetical protein